jgi:hypothetical protein
MNKQISFTKYGNQVLPHFRERISKAESTEDVKKFFIYTARELFAGVFAGELELDYEDVALTPKTAPHFTLSDRLLADARFAASWHDSDLPTIIGHLADTAVKRYTRLEKNPAKSQAKIRMPA